MNFKQSTFGEIIESEKEMFLTAASRYGDYFINASEFNIFLNECIKSVDPDRYIFAMFFSQIRKHSTLALLSTVRLHHVQAMMDLRQVLEAASCAAYAIANTDVKDFADIDDKGIADASQELTKKRYKWLETNFPAGSTAIFNMKKTINSSSAHSSIIYAHSNFKFDEQAVKFETPFFDFEDEYLIKIDLWQIGNIIMGITGLFYGINKNLNVIKFAGDFIQRLKSLEEENHRLKAEMMNTERYKKTIEKK